MINAIGNLGDIIGPSAIGWAQDNLGSFAGGYTLLPPPPRLQLFG
jgi:hypothetical protein